MSSLRPFALAALMGAASLTAHAASERQRIDTRYGAVEVRESPGNSDIVFKGQVVRKIPSVGASLYRVSAHGEREFVIVEVLKPVVRCNHSFVFVELFANGTAQASKDFGECRELRAVEFNGAGQPFLRLREPYTVGAGAAQGSSDFVWKDAQIVQVAGSAASNAASAQAIASAAAQAASMAAAAPAVPAAAKPAAVPAKPAAVAASKQTQAPTAPAVEKPGAAAPALAAKAAPATPAVVAAPSVAAAAKALPASVATGSAKLAAAAVAEQASAALADKTPATSTAKAPTTGCEAAASAAKSGGQTIARSSAMRQVGGAGRLQFHAAPAAGCEKRGLFVVPGDLLDAYTVYQNYTFVHYVNPKNGRAVEGWVPSDRLVSPSREQ